VRIDERRAALDESKFGPAKRLVSRCAALQVKVEHAHQVGGGLIGDPPQRGDRRRAPDASSARLKLYTPSPRTSGPRSVSQALKTASSTSDSGRS